MKRRLLRVRRILTGFALLCCLLLSVAQAEEARDLTAQCTFAASAKPRYTYCLLYNGDYRYAWQTNRAKNVYLEIRLPQGETCSGVQIKWYKVPAVWNVEVKQGTDWVSYYGTESEYLTAYVPLPGVTAFRIAAHQRIADRLMINELNVLSAGETPGWVQRWEPVYEEADLLLVAAHPDDEYIFMGGTIPYYGSERGKKVLVAYLTEGTAQRRTELLDGLWAVGQKSYPLLGPFKDQYSNNLEEAYAQIGKARTQRYMIELFRHYRPKVVVTHDVKGEYGHGAHRLCADIVLNALAKAADADVEPALAAQYGVWDVPKAYLHLYPENQIEMDWHQPLTAFKGKSAFEMAQAGFACHLSQQRTKFMVYDDGPYDSRKYGLVRSLVGADREKDDFFEHLDESWLVTGETGQEK